MLDEIERYNFIYIDRCMILSALPRELCNQEKL